MSLKKQEMKKYLLCCVACICMLQCNYTLHAQEDAELYDYLVHHRYAFRMNADSSLSFTDDGMEQMLLNKMKDNSLFVYGEGWSHRLRANGRVITALTNLFAEHGLRDFYAEAARSWVVCDNLFFRLSNKTAAAYYPGYDAYFRDMLTEEKKVFGNKVNYYGVDFERAFSFPEALNNIAGFVDADKLPKLYKLAPYFTDSSYVKLKPKQFVQWYKQQQAAFYKDSIQYRELMGKVYPYFLYLMSDPEPSRYIDERNYEMAKHVLWQMGEPVKGAIYFLDCGMAHSRIGKRDGLSKTTVRRLADSKELKGRIVVMNLCAENSKITGDNSGLNFMKGKVQQAFSKAADGDIIVFDLADAPTQYRYIAEKYGELVVYVKGQN